jgi:hypothetical protein
VVQHCSMPKVEPQLHDLSPELKWASSCK